MLFVMCYCFLVNYSNNQRCGCCQRCCLAWWWITTAWCAHHIDLVDTNKEQYTGINVNKVGGEVEEIHSKAHTRIYFTASHMQSFHLYCTSFKPQQAQPELWLELTEDHEITSKATAVRMMLEGGETNKQKKQRKCHQKCVGKRKQAGFWVTGFERLQTSKRVTHCLKEHMELVQVRKVQWHYCHVVIDMLSKIVIHFCFIFCTEQGVIQSVMMAFWSFSLSPLAINPSRTSFHSINSHLTH